MKKPLQNILFLVAIMVISITSSGKAQCVTANQTIGSGANQLDISISVESSINQVRFDITGPASAWFGFSFNTTTMSPGSYTILANVSGGNPAEYIMVNHAAPTVQPVQNLTSINAATSSGRKTYTFFRDLSTGDANDFIFAAVAGNLNIAWAYGGGLSLAYHGDRGSTTLSFTDPCANNTPIVLPAVTICQGDSAMIFGQYQSAPGLYADTVSIPWECDTIRTQTLVVQQGTVVYDTNNTMLCMGDSVMIQGNWYHQAAQIPVFSAKQGCDSLFDLFIIEVVSIDTTVTSMGGSLMVSSGYDQYHWIDCTTGLTAAGSTNSHTYTPTAMGMYKVEITQDGCMAESSCHAGGTSGMESNPAGQGLSFRAFPNPASEYLNISLEAADKPALLQVWGVHGERYIEIQLQPGQTQETLDLQPLSPGIYFIQLKQEGIPGQPKRFIRI